MFYFAFATPYLITRKFQLETVAAPHGCAQKYSIIYLFPVLLQPFHTQFAISVFHLTYLQILNSVRTIQQGPVFPECHSLNRRSFRWKPIKLISILQLANIVILEDIF